MDIILSYALSLEAKSQLGTVPADLIQEHISFLDQALSNVLIEAKTFKSNLNLVPGSSGNKTLDLGDVGINYLRAILIKSSNVLNLVIDNKAATGKLIFIDYGQPPTPLPIRVSNIVVTLANPTILPVNTTVIAIGY